MNTMWEAARPHVTSLIRHGLTGLAVWSATKYGLPALDDATVTGLAVFVTGAIGLAWSQLEAKKKRR